MVSVKVNFCTFPSTFEHRGLGKISVFVYLRDCIIDKQFAEKFVYGKS